MKHLSRALIAVILAVLMATLMPSQVFADTPDYISEVKIASGKNSYEELAKDLKGYTILKSGDSYADLNEGAGSDNAASSGQSKVLLGYKTTKKRSEAITDLAVMNMKGGYSIEEYDMLMEKYIKEQILPFIEGFSDAITEYRANYNSSNKYNKQRAVYYHDALNKLIDDDTGKGLGDLLLNPTKEELGSEYNKLSDEEKKNHADLTTILAQSNGKATLAMENFITRASDSNTNSWIDRLKNTSYDDLIKATGLAPTDARKATAKKYDDDAQKIAEAWSVFRDQLLAYDDYKQICEDFDSDEAEAVIEEYEGADDSRNEELEAEYNNAIKSILSAAEAKQFIAIHDYLKGIEYLDGTLLDFFTQPYDEIIDNIALLYPVAASLSAGQKAGLEFVSLKEMVSMAMNSKTDFDNEYLKQLDEASIYTAVDREIYKNGGVGLTSEARRAKVPAVQPADEHKMSKLNLILAFSAVGTFVTAAVSLVSSLSFQRYAFNKMGVDFIESAISGATICTYLGVAFTLVTIFLLVYSFVSDYYEAKEYYKTEFTPIPHYMVDVKDITGYNNKGERIILKNQSAYYKAVECNRDSSYTKFKEIGTYADLNGDVGRQWLALYAVKNETEEPILADSLLIGNGNDIPAGYQTGIHMFGDDTVFNLNSSMFCWNKDAKKICVYFKRESSKPTTAGSNFTTGMMALAGGGGLVLGACITAVAMKATGKRKENKVQTA